MPQDDDSGRRGRLNGYRNADLIGEQLGAVRISQRSNEFQWNDRIILIKTGSSAIVTRATLERVQAVIYGVAVDGWTLYEIDPETFEELSVASASRNHDETYRRVRRTQIRENGRRLNQDPAVAPG